MGDLYDLREEDIFKYRGRIFNCYSSPGVLDETCNFTFLPTDIIVSTYARSGTTFTQEIVWQIKNCKNILKGEKVDKTLDRFPFIEYNYKLHPEITISFCDLLDSQRNNPYRLIKTHVPYEFIKDSVEKVNPKFIVTMRNAKDCLVSNYEFFKYFGTHPYQGTFDEYFLTFLNDKSISGSYFDNNLDWWQIRHRDNVLILFYEDLVKNLEENVKKIANFLGETLSVDDINKVMYNVSFSTMSSNSNVNFQIKDNFTFLRKGLVGDWKNYLSEEQNKILDRKVEEKFKKFGLEFIYE